MPFQPFLQRKIKDRHFRDVLTGGALFVVFRGLSIPAGFIFTWWVSKYYGAGILGVCTVLFSVWSLVEVAVNTSFKQYMVRNLAVLYQQGRTGLYNASVLRTLYLGAGCVTVLVALLMALSDVVAESFFDSSYGKVIFYTAPVLLVLTVSGILQENLRLRKKLTVFNFLSLAAHGFFSLLLLLLLHYTLSSVLNPLWAHLSAIACTFMLSVAFSVRYWEKAAELSANEQPESYTDVLRVITPLFLSAAGANLSYQIPLFLLSYFHSEQLAGIYAVLFTVSRLVALPLMVVNYNIAPKFVELLHGNKHAELQQLLHKNSRMLTLTSAFIFMLIMLFPSTILTWMGEVYGHYTLELTVLCMAQLVNVWAGSVNILMVTSGHEKMLSRYNLILLVTGVAAGWMFIAPFGLAAGIGLRAAIMVVMNVLLSIYLFKKLQLRTFWWVNQKVL